jgi:hypothetical protein
VSQFSGLISCGWCDVIVTSTWRIKSTNSANFQGIADAKVVGWLDVCVRFTTNAALNCNAAGNGPASLGKILQFVCRRCRACVMGSRVEAAAVNGW